MLGLWFSRPFGAGERENMNKIMKAVSRASFLRKNGKIALSAHYISHLVNTMGFPFELVIEQLKNGMEDTKHKQAYKDFCVVLLDQYAEDQIKHLRDSGAGEKAIERRRKKNVKELEWAIDQLDLATELEV